MKRKMQATKRLDVTVIKRRYRAICRYPNCENKYYRSGGHKLMHKFRANKQMAYLWKKNCNIDESINCRNYYICEDHFKDEDYAYPEARQLKVDAVPVPFDITTPNNPADKKTPKIHNHSRYEQFACINRAPEAYKCKICNFTSDFKVILIDHAVEVHNLPKIKHNIELIMKKLECQNCNLETYSFLLFKLHHCNPSKLKRKIIKTKEIGCDASMRPRHSLYTTEDHFLRIRKFSKHRSSHIDKNTDLLACNIVLDLYKCRICDFTTDLQVLLKNHIREAHKAPILFNYLIENFACSVCNFQTFSLLILYEHVSTHENGMPEYNNKWYSCTLCSYKTMKGGSLKVHFRRKHPTGTLFKCARCKFTFVERTRFEMHLKRHSVIVRDNSTKCYYCEFCKYRTHYLCNLKKHLLVKHEDDHRVKWFRCEHCDYKCKLKVHLTAHLKSIHSGKRKIVWLHCKYCQYKSVSRSRFKNHLLEQHEQQHFNKWIHCEHCEYKTAELYSMRRHITYRHTDPNEIHWFKCELCERKFKRKNILKTHVWTQHIIEKKSRKYARIGKSNKRARVDFT